MNLLLPYADNMSVKNIKNRIKCMKTRFDFGRFRCAIFDLDGTLLNSTDVWAKVDIDFSW